MDNLLVVVGTGLIGSSFAKGAREQGLFKHIIGIEPDCPFPFVKNPREQLIQLRPGHDPRG